MAVIDDSIETHHCIDELEGLHLSKNLQFSSIASSSQSPNGFHETIYPILDPSSVFGFEKPTGNSNRLSTRYDGIGWYEMTTEDGIGNIEYHYGKRRQNKGTTSLKRLTIEELEKLEESNVLSLGVYFLIQHTFMKFDRLYDCKHNLTKEEQKWRLIIAYSSPETINRIHPKDLWFEMETHMNGETHYHYGRPRELRGCTSSMPMTIKELDLLHESEMPTFDIFFIMQALLAPLFNCIQFGSNDSPEMQISLYKMLDNILDTVRSEIISECESREIQIFEKSEAQADSDAEGTVDIEQVEEEEVEVEEPPETHCFCSIQCLIGCLVLCYRCN